MGQVRKIFCLVVTILLAAVAVTAAGPEPRTMSDEVLELLAKGYKNLSQSKFNEAQIDYGKVIKLDFDNPYANNNLAVLMEKQQKLTDAMTYLNIGEKSAAQYLNEIDTSYLFGTVCAAVQVENVIGETSRVALIIAENKKKLAEKLGAAPLWDPKSGK